MKQIFLAIIVLISHVKSEEEGQVRLINNSSGLLEVYFDGEWGYVCDDGWNEVNGDVVCSILGYEDAIYSSGFHFSIDVNYKLNYIDCTGGEKSLLNCSYSPYTPNFCSIYEHVFISCVPEEGQVRLTNYSSGLLEVYFGREWGYVCDDGWNEVNGDVVCSILGYEGANSSSGSHFSSDVNYKLNYIDCTGGEESLLNCTYSLYTSDVCSVSEHVFISCISVEEGKVRLTDDISGLLEVYFDGEWGYVCDDGWNEVNGDVVCRILGYEGAISSSGAHISTDVNYKLNYIDCTGGEESLLDCTHSPYILGFCSVYEHVFISCISGTSNGCDLIYDSSCYKVFEVSTPINWLEAQSSCAIWGGDLTSITTERENNYLNTLITSSVGNSWIGLNDRNAEGMYTWVDGTAVNYTNWTSTPSDDINSNCVQINNAGNGVWESVSCEITLNAFLCKRDSSSYIAIADRFGRLTDGGLGFEELSPNTFIFDSLTLACGSDGSPISRIYSQYNTDLRYTEPATYSDTQLGLSWLNINISKQGYYLCYVYQIYFKEIGVFDLSLTTVAVSGNTYTYIIGIDREDVQLLCDPINHEYLFDVKWIGEDLSYFNPIHISSELSRFPSVSTPFTCKRGEHVIISSHISAKAPRLSLSNGAGLSESFFKVYPELNEFMIPSAVQEITLSMNIEGNWALPDDSQSTNSILTIPNFSSHNIGVYKFYIKNWDKIEVCAVQIHIGIIVKITDFDDPSQQVNYTVGSPISMLYYSNPDILDSVIRWTTDIVSNGDTNIYSVEYPNPVNLSEVFANVGAGLQKFSCFYRKSPVTLLGSLQLAIKDTMTISISYEDYNMSFSDANNPIFPFPQEIRILEGTKDIRFTCGLDYCYWIISHQNGIIISDTAYTIPELTNAFNGNISLEHVTSSGTLYTTAQISIHVIQHEAESNNSTVFVSIIVLLVIFIGTATTIIISVYIFLYVKRQKSTGDFRPKISKAGGEAFPGYVNLGAANPPEKDHDTNPDYMTIDETSLVTTDTQEKNKPKSMLSHSEPYINIPPTQKREYVNMEQENTNEKYSVMTPKEENCTKLSPKFISTENFSVVYQQYVDSGIGKDSIFSIEFQKLNEHLNQVCILEHDDALKLENGQKNPIKNILPFDENRIVLDSPHFECDYINASYMHVSGYQFIATIHPTKETHRDFLQMIYQTGASMVIMLTTRKEKAKIISGVSKRICYWPKKNDPINCEPFVSTLIKSTEMNAFVKQDISLKEISTGKEHSFTQCISPIWNEDSTVAEMALGVALLSKIIKHKQDSNNAPVVIHCEDGISKTGIILTVLNAIRDINLRKSVNIFSTVRFLRVQRMNMIPTLACYTTCYSLLNEYCSIHL